MIQDSESGYEIVLENILLIWCLGITPTCAVYGLYVCEFYGAAWIILLSEKKVINITVLKGANPWLWLAELLKDKEFKN